MLALRHCAMHPANAPVLTLRARTVPPTGIVVIVAGVVLRTTAIALIQLLQLFVLPEIRNAGHLVTTDAASLCVALNGRRQRVFSPRFY